jgi:hypothetical protein
MSDLAHHSTAGGEYLWHSPTLAHDLFQTKAWVLGETWEALLRQLPQPMSINPRYDLYRLHNLATLLALRPPDLSTNTGDRGIITRPVSTVIPGGQPAPLAQTHQTTQTEQLP